MSTDYEYDTMEKAAITILDILTEVSKSPSTYMKYAEGKVKDVIKEIQKGETYGSSVLWVDKNS